MSYQNKTTPGRTADKKTSFAQPTQVSTPATSNSQIMGNKKQQQDSQVQKVETTSQEYDKQMILQLIAQEVNEYMKNPLQQIKQLENQYNELTQENQYIKQKIEQQEQKIQQQDYKIQQQEYKIQKQQEKIEQQERTIESQNQNQGRNEIHEKIQNFISNNDKAHENWRKSQEQLQKACQIIETQFSDIEDYKYQIAQKVSQYNDNITQKVQVELKIFTEQIQQTQQQTQQNLSCLINYEDTLRKYCEEINKYLNLQGNHQISNYNGNQYQNTINSEQYLQQQDQSQYSQIQYTQQYPQQLEYTQQTYQTQINFNNSQFQQPSNYNQTLQNDQYGSNIQDQQQGTQQVPQQGKSKIRLLSSTQGPAAQ